MTVHVGSVGPPIRANTMETEVFRQALSSLLGGSQGIVNATDFGVTQNGSPNMSVNVSSGFAFVQGSSNSPVQGAYPVYNDAVVNLVVTTANATNPRIDVVALTIQDAFYAGATNTALLQVIAGTAAASPLVPVLPASTIPLAHIYVGAAVSSILTANINGVAGANNPDTSPFIPQRAGTASPRQFSSIQSAQVLTLESTASAAYVDLTTVGPSVTAYTGTTALVILGAYMGHNVQFNVNLMAVAVTGATTIAAIDGNSISFKEPDTSTGSASSQITGIVLVTGLTPGWNIFTAKYRTGAASANYSNRKIAVIPL